MKTPRLIFCSAGAAVLAGLAAYTAGMLAPGKTDRAGDRATPEKAAPVSEDSFPAWTSVPLPGVRPANAAEFDACVEGLVQSGLKKKFAQWVALSAFTRADLRGSLEVAREQKLLDMWSAIAAGTEPREAFALLSDAPSSDSTIDLWLGKGEGAQPSFFAALGQSDPVLAMELASSLPDSSQALPLRALFQSWATRDPVEALTQARMLGPEREQRVATSAALGAWAGADLEGMMEWAELQQDPAVLKMAFQSLWEFHGIRSPATVIEMMQRHPEAAPKFLQNGITDALAQRGTEGWKVIAGLKPGPLRENLARNFGRSLSQRDPAAAWEFAQSLPPDDRRIFLKSGLSNLASQFPAEIAEHLAGEERIDSGAAENLLQGWQQTDPARALAWARENVQGNLLVEKSGSLLAALYEKDPAEALATWAALPDGLRIRSLSDLAKQRGAAQPEEALAWAATLPPNEQRRALANVLEGWAGIDPREAAAALLHLPEQKLGSAIETISRALARKSLPEAETWVAKLPAAQAEPATEALFREWASRDSAAASERLDTLPPGNLRDRSIVGFSWSASPYDPESAAVWASSIGDSSLRKRAFCNLAYNWREKDRSAARAFATGIPDPAVRQEILGIVNQRD